jgi:ABC-2 type transport system ATP-binding protein
VAHDRLELRPPPGTDPVALATAMAGLGSAAPVVDADAGRVVVPVVAGPAILPEVAALLAACGLTVSDLALRRPSLDDVFLTLTGQPTDKPSTMDTPTAARTR